jgi:ribosome-binding factor A
MNNDGVRNIKIAQKESLLLREISSLFMKTAADDPRLSRLTINRVKLSTDKGSCSIFFYTKGGQKEFKDLLEVLKLYKPSLRSALAKSIKSRYTPELIFKYDEQYEKEEKLNQLLESLKAKGEL